MGAANCLKVDLYIISYTPPMSTWVEAHLGSGMLKVCGDIRREQILAGIEIGVRSVGKSILWDSSAFVMVEPSRRDRHEGEKNGEAPAEHPQSSQVQVVLVSVG